MTQQVFISYRRDGGEFLGKMVYDELVRRHIPAFYDVESLRETGKFNERILEVIANCDGFIIVLTKGALDRCIDESDWVARELRCAFEHGKRIIPLITRGFEFPSDLPDDIMELRHYQGVTVTNEYFAAAMNKLLDLLDTGNSFPMPGRYHDTCKNLLTPTVLRFAMRLNDLKADADSPDKVIGASLLLECIRYGVNGFEFSKYSDLFEKIHLSPGGYPYDALSVYRAGVAEAVLKLYSPEERDELVPFLETAAALWEDRYVHIGEITDHPEKNAIPDIRSEGISYRVIDVFTESDHQFAVCRDNNNNENELPKVYLFEVGFGTEPSPIDRNSVFCRNMLLQYTTFYRLYEMFPGFWREGRTMFKQNLPDDVYTAFIFNQYHKFPRIAAEISSGGLLKSKQRVVVTQDYCSGTDPLKTKFGSEAVLDIVKMSLPAVKDKVTYYLLTCPISSKFKSSTTRPPLVRKPHIHALNVKIAPDVDFPPATLTEDIKLSKLDPLLIDRFALRMQAFDAVSNILFE